MQGGMSGLVRSWCRFVAPSISAAACMAVLWPSADACSAVCPGTASQPYAVITPNGGQLYRVGDTMNIEVCTSDPVNSAIGPENRPRVYLSVDNGKTWYPMYEGEDSYIEDTRAKWVIGDSLDSDFGAPSVSTISDSCKLKVMDYMDNGLFDVSDNVFSIKKAGSAAIAPRASRPSGVSRGRFCELRFTKAGIAVWDSRSARLMTHTGRSIDKTRQGGVSGLIAR